VKGRPNRELLLEFPRNCSILYVGDRAMEGMGWETNTKRSLGNLLAPMVLGLALTLELLWLLQGTSRGPAASTAAHLPPARGETRPPHHHSHLLPGRLAELRQPGSSVPSMVVVAASQSMLRIGIPGI
jgi:hypothetical protein